MQVKRSSMLPGGGCLASRLSDLSTGELVSLARDGEREAFDPLYRRFSDRVLANAVRRAGGDRDWAEDIAAEVWATAMEKVGRWREREDDTEDSFLYWLFAITRNLIARSHAEQWREVPGEPEFGWESVGTRVGAEPEREVSENPIKGKLLASLRGEVGRLSPRQRKVVGLMLDGLSYEEISEKTGLSGRDVRAAWQHGQAALRVRLGCPIESVDPALLRASAQSLPETQRVVALLRLDGVRDREIAERTGLDYRQVRDAWMRAKDGMRRRLAEPTASGLTDERAAARRAAAEERQRARLREAAQLLPPGQRRVALLRLDGMRYREIAASLGLTRGGAESIWRQARSAFIRGGHLAAV